MPGRPGTAENPRIACALTFDFDVESAISGQLQTTLTHPEEAVQEADVARVAAEDANRLKSEFLSHMSHDLRTPMNDIPDLAKVEAGHVELARDAVDLPKLVGLVVETVRPKAQAKGIERSIETTGETPAVEGDEIRLGQILLNLAKDLSPAEVVALQHQTAAVMRKTALRAEDVLTEVRTALARANFARALATR